MSTCKHRELVLLSETNNKVRCRHCHLTISEDELGDGYCPECYEVDDMKRYDFENLIPKSKEMVRYRCEECGAMIEYPEQ